MKVKPCFNNIVVIPDEKIKRKGAIIVPDQSQEATYMGKVVAVGEGKFDNNGNLLPMKIKVGDKVLYRSYGVTKVDIDGKEYFILEDINVLAVLEGK